MFLKCISIILFSLVFLLNSPCWALADYGKQSLIGADFSNSDLKGATFYLTDLHSANLSGSDLEGATLFGAKLLDADLSNTNLKNATLDSAILEGTNLDNALLEDSFAFNTQFINVSINGADFTNVILTVPEQTYLCSIADGINPITSKKTIETLECN